PFTVDVSAAEEIWLLVDPTADGNPCDWTDWCEPMLTAADGKTAKLTDLDWTYAFAGWGEVGKNKSAGGAKLAVANEDVPFGIGTHAFSMIGFKLDKK